MDPITLVEFIVITPHVLQDHDAKVGEGGVGLTGIVLSVTWCFISLRWPFMRI